MPQWLACSPCAQEDVGSNPSPAASEKCLNDVCPQAPVSRINLNWMLYKYITFYNPIPLFYDTAIEKLLQFVSRRHLRNDLFQLLRSQHYE